MREREGKKKNRIRDREIERETKKENKRQRERDCLSETEETSLSWYVEYFLHFVITILTFLSRSLNFSPPSVKT